MIFSTIIEIILTLIFCATILQYIVLNPRWLISGIQCIFQGDSFEDLTLEVREIKRDLDIDEEPNEFLESCLNCPIITREDICLLLGDSEAIKNVTDEREMNVKLLRLMLIRLGVMLPLDMGIQRKNQEVYLIPKFLEEDQALYWSYKCSDSRKKVVCSSWLLKGSKPHNLMESIIKQIIQETYNITHVTGGDHSSSSTQQKSVALCDLLCWKNAILLKFGVKIPKGSDNSDCSQEFVEVLLYYGDKNSPLCVASNTMKPGEKRLILSAKGPSAEVIDTILDGG